MVHLWVSRENLAEDLMTVAANVIRQAQAKKRAEALGMRVRFESSDEAVDMEITGTVADMEDLIRQMAAVGYSSFTLDADARLEAHALRHQLDMIRPKVSIDIEVKEASAHA